MRIVLVTATVAACLFTLPTAFGWGRLGHQTIATVAVANLNSTAQTVVLDILAKSTTTEISTPANAASWPDDIKPGHTLSGTTNAKAFNTGFPHNDNWHFVNYPLEGTYTLTGPFSSPQDVVHQINMCIDVLEHKPGAPVMKDEQALAFLIHLVGDIHQPLHVGCGYYQLDASKIVHLIRDPDQAAGLAHDAGGNKLVWGQAGPHQPEFHAFWDDTLASANGSTNKKLGESITANWNKVTLATRPADHHHWAEAWASDSIATAKRVYVDPTGLEGTPSIDHKHNDEKVMTIDIDLDEDSYKEAHTTDALDQLTKAARDLCDLLNRIQWPSHHN